MALVGTSQIAKALNLTTRRVSQLVEEGVLPKAGRGRFDLGPVMLAYIRYVQTALDRRDLLNDDGESAAVRRERARLLKAQADDAEIELARKRGELIPVEIFEHEMAALLSAARANLLNLPQRIAPLVVGETSVAKARETIREEVYSALRTVSIPDHRLPRGNCDKCGQPTPESIYDAGDAALASTHAG